MRWVAVEGRRRDPQAGPQRLPEAAPPLRIQALKATLPAAGQVKLRHMRRRCDLPKAGFPEHGAGRFGLDQANPQAGQPIQTRSSQLRAFGAPVGPPRQITDVAQQRHPPPDDDDPSRFAGKFDDLRMLTQRAESRREARVLLEGQEVHAGR